MQLMIGARQVGKTTKLIEFAHNESIYIVCADRERAFWIKKLAVAMGKNILMPVTINELMGMHGYHSSIDFVVDELGDCFRNLFRDKKFLIANLTSDNYEKQNIDDTAARNSHLYTLLNSRDELIRGLKAQILNLEMTLAKTSKDNAKIINTLLTENEKYKKIVDEIINFDCEKCEDNGSYCTACCIDTLKNIAKQASGVQK